MNRAEKITALSDALGGLLLSPEALVLYVAALEDMTDEQLDTALGRAMKEAQHMPRPAELRKLAGAGCDPEAEALEALAQVRRAIGAHGRYESVDFEDKAKIFSDFVVTLLDTGLVAPNPVTAAILSNLDDIQNVADMAEVAALSPRQLQRALKATTGFTPHDLWKVLRVQHSFRQDYLLLFADQSHFTHSFRNLTGYTPGKFNKTFDV